MTRARRGKVRLHATDLEPKPGQRTITAVCFKRVSVDHALQYSPDHVTCVGCLAILAERDRENERARRRAGLQ